MLLRPLTGIEFKTLADAIVSSDPELANGLHYRLAQLIPLLPDVDQEILEFAARGIEQKDVGKLYGTSQSGISHRLNRAKERLRWLVARPPKPESFLLDLNRALSLRGRTRHPAAHRGVALYADITCQSKAAVLVCTTQSCVKRWVAFALAGLETLGLSESLAYLRHTYNTPNMLNEGIGESRGLRSIVKPPSTREAEPSS